MSPNDDSQMNSADGRFGHDGDTDRYFAMEAPTFGQTADYDQYAQPGDGDDPGDHYYGHGDDVEYDGYGFDRGGCGCEDHDSPEHEAHVAMAGTSSVAGDPIDEDADLDLPHWAGVIPLTSTWGAPVADDLTPTDVTPPAEIAGLQGTVLGE